MFLFFPVATELHYVLLHESTKTSGIINVMLYIFHAHVDRFPLSD